MKKYTLIKFFDGEASEAEVDSIIEWVNKSVGNKEYFARLKALYTASCLANEPVNETPGTVKSSVSKRGKRRILYIAGAAAIALLFFSIGYFIAPELRPSEEQTLITGIYDSVNINKEEVAQLITLYTEKGVKGFMMLPDSSKVWLNSDSKITYPEQFSGKMRNVRLSGEAYFEVKKDEQRPMIVETSRGFAVEVLGTTFNIKCYDNDDLAVTTLYTGAITVNYRNSQTNTIEHIALKPNESVSYIPAVNTLRQLNYKKPEIQKAWKDGELIFDNTPMEEVLKILERWHGTSFIIKNKNIYNYKLSAQFSSESIVQIMEIVELIINVSYTYDNNTVTIR